MNPFFASNSYPTTTNEEIKAVIKILKFLLEFFVKTKHMKFEKINEDTFKLIANDKEFVFTRTVDLAKELQSVDMYTTAYVAEFLAERGETLDNTKLRVERKVNGQTIVDESNIEALKKQAQNLAYYDVINKIFKKIFGKGYMDQLKEIGIKADNVEEVSKFTSELTQILMNGIDDNTPSK